MIRKFTFNSSENAKTMENWARHNMGGSLRDGLVVIVAFADTIPCYFKTMYEAKTLSPVVNESIAGEDMGMVIHIHDISKETRNEFIEYAKEKDLPYEVSGLPSRTWIYIRCPEKGSCAEEILNMLSERKISTYEVA